jgi:hypothetical protein
MTIPARELRVGYIVVLEEESEYWHDEDDCETWTEEVSRAVEIVDHAPVTPTPRPMVAVALEGRAEPIFYDLDDQVVVHACKDSF